MQTWRTWERWALLARERASRARLILSCWHGVGQLLKLERRSAAWISLGDASGLGPMGDGGRPARPQSCARGRAAGSTARACLCRDRGAMHELCGIWVAVLCVAKAALTIAGIAEPCPQGGALRILRDALSLKMETQTLVP